MRLFKKMYQKIIKLLKLYAILRIIIFDISK